MGPLFIPQATTATATSPSQRGAATTTGPTAMEAAASGEEDITSSTSPQSQEQPTYSQIIEHEHGHNHNHDDDDLIVPINYNNNNNNLNHHHGHSHVPKLRSHNFVHYHDAHPNHSSLYDTGQNEHNDHGHPPPPPPPLMLRPTNTNSNENRNNCPQSLSSSSSLSRSDNNLLRKYIILLQDCVAIKFIPYQRTTPTAATTPAEYEALSSRMVNGGVPSGIVGCGGGGGEGGPSSLLLSSSASTGDDDINHDVNHSQQGIFLFKIFRESNLKCYWNPSITSSISSLQFKGYLIPSTILLSSPSPQHLNTLRTAYSRRILRHPPGYRIELLAEIEEIVAQPVQQGQFAPLSDSLCWAILELTSGGREAFVESIMEVLVGGSFPGMMRSGLPRQELVYQTLEKLIREHRIYQTSKGYHVVTPEVSSFMNYSRCVTPGGGRMGMVTPTGMGVGTDPLYFNAHVPKQHSSWGSTGSVLEHEDLLFNRRRNHHHQPTTTPLRRHHSLKIIRQRDRVGDDGTSTMTAQPCMGARSLSFRLSKVNSLFDSDKEEGDGDDDDYGYFEDYDHDMASFAINSTPTINARRSNSRCCNGRVNNSGEGEERRRSVDNERGGEEKVDPTAMKADNNNNLVAKKRRSFFRRWLYNSFRRLKRPGPVPPATSTNVAVANNNNPQQPIHLQQLPKSPRQTNQPKQQSTIARDHRSILQSGRQIKSTCSSSTQTLNKISKSSEHLAYVDILSGRNSASRRIHSSSAASSSSNNKWNSLPSHNRYNQYPARKSILSESSPFYDDLIGSGGHPPQRSTSRRSLTPNTMMGNNPLPNQFQPHHPNYNSNKISSPCPSTIRSGHHNTAPNRIPPLPPSGQPTSASHIGHNAPNLCHPQNAHQKRAYPRVFQRYNKCCSTAPGAHPQQVPQHLSSEQQSQIRTGHRHHPRIIPTRPRSTSYQIYSSSSEQHEKEMFQLLTNRHQRQHSSSSSSTRSSTTTTATTNKGPDQPPIRLSSSSSSSSSQKNKIHKLDVSDNRNEELIPNRSNTNGNVDGNDEMLITTRMMKGVSVRGGNGDDDIPLIPHHDADHHQAKNPIVPRNGDDRNSTRGSSDDVSH